MPQIQETPIVSLRALALYDNTSETSEELSFRSGDILTVLEQDYAGYMGWWLCSLRGKQGICPGNRLRILGEPEVASPGDGTKKGWNQPPKAIPLKTEVYLYDQPKAAVSGPQIQYDMVPSTHPPVDVGSGESYDVPRPLLPASPTSSLSSLTSDSNRSSLIQEYDIPKPARHVPQPQEEYDVPRDIPLELGPALEWLGRLEGEASSAVRLVLGCVVSNWRKRERLQPKLQDIRVAVHRLRTALHDLVLFGRAALLNASNMQCGGGVISNRLKPLVETLSEADSKVECCWRELDSMGWAVESLCLEESYRTPGGDALDSIVATAAALQDEISSLASFIQGNATLLFRKNEEPAKTWTDDYDYVNIECKERQQEENGSKGIENIDALDLKVLKFYGCQFGRHLSDLDSAVTAFIDSVEQNQPPRVFLIQVKFVILAGHRLVHVADAAGRGLGTKQVSAGLVVAANSLADSLQAAVRCTKDAALHFPNINTVQKMVNAIYSVSDHARKMKHALDIH